MGRPLCYTRCRIASLFYTPKAQIGATRLPHIMSTIDHQDATDAALLGDERKLQLEQKKVLKKLRREAGKAIHDFGMIEEGDKVMVCISGGKDSLAMLDILLGLQKSAPIHFDLVAVNLDQKQPGFPEHVLPQYFESLGVDYDIIEEDTYSIVTEMVPEGKTYCGWCSRFRRAILYKYAKKMVARRSRSAITETTLLKRYFSICSTVAS